MTALLDMSRRHMVLGLAASGVVLDAALAADSAPVTAKDDPRRSAVGQMKLGGSLDGRPVPWWYVGTVYADQPGKAPLPLVDLEGCEAYWPEKQADGSFLVKGTTITFFRDHKTGEFIQTFDNPLTGKTVPVKPNVLAGGGGMLFPADGTAPRALGLPESAQAATYGKADPNKPLGEMKWVTSGDVVILMGYRAPPSPVQPLLEAQSTFGSLKQFMDPSVMSMEATFTSSYFAPFMRWLEMGDAPGHVLWHSSGRKMPDFDALPREYFAMAEKVFPGKLTAKPG